MIRVALAIAMLWVLVPRSASAQQAQQALVDRATLTVQDMVNDRDGTQGQAVLKQARAVLICPRIFQAGFLIGGQGGACVLVARAGGGSWSAPAFYGLTGASFGFQAGVQDAEVILFIMNDRGLAAILDSQFKLGADASATFIDLGGGVEGGTTAALTADIVGFTRARGLYAGISLGGSLLNSRTAWNQAYYGQPFAARQIVVSMQASNPAADSLRQTLIRYGGPGPVAHTAPRYVTPEAAPQVGPGYGPQPGYAPSPSYSPPRAAIQQTPLPPPQRLN